MNVSQILSKFKSPSISNYPELTEYTRSQIYKGKMGPGGLYLATRMIRKLNLTPESIVLDLGCGNGASSLFISKKTNATIFAVDLWIDPTSNFQRIRDENLSRSVLPFKLDITEKLPFAFEYFDAIFIMDSIHYYGGNKLFWNHLLPHLKQNGRLVIGSPCFSEEFSEEALNNLPFEYNDGTDLWPKEFSKYHSPMWWGALLSDTKLVCNIESREIEDGVIFWEDDVLFNLENNGNHKAAMIDAAQYTFRKVGYPYLTHFILSANKL